MPDMVKPVGYIVAAFFAAWYVASCIQNGGLVRLDEPQCVQVDAKGNVIDAQILPPALPALPEEVQRHLETRK